MDVRAGQRRLSVEELTPLNRWRRPLTVPWTPRISNQSNLKEISPEYSLEGMILKLKLQYLGHLMQRTDSLEKILMLRRLRAGGEGGQGDEIVGWRYQLNGQECEQTPRDSVGPGSLACCSQWDHKESDMTE